MKIASKSSNICIKSVNPHFKYRFKEAGVPISVEESHIEKILRNSDFYESDKAIKLVTKPTKKGEKRKEKTFKEELIEINGIGIKTAEDILIVFPTKGKLLEALSKDEKLPFDDDIEKKLTEVFVH